jgi:glucose/arabinose dehydrogenase
VILLLAGIAVRRPLLAWLEGAAAAATSRSAGESGNAPPARVRFEPIASGFSEPVDLQFVPGRPAEAVVLEKGGRARLVKLPQAQGVEMSGADVVTLAVHKHSELGLLGLAFHPRYAENGLFYLNDNPRDDGPLRTRVSEWELPVDELGKRPARHMRTLLEIDQPYPNHDGGQLVFGPDNYLYVGMGDGGSRADPQNVSQNLGSLLGKMLRIDVDVQPGGAPYGIPSGADGNPAAGNPLCNDGGSSAQDCPEVFALGFRNPWRWSFDRQAGDLWLGDVGQGSWEEIDVVERGGNYGWNAREGAHCFMPATGCQTAGLLDPVAEYDHDLGLSITGGYVYRGGQPTVNAGRYVFGDFGGMIASLAPDGASGFEIEQLSEQGCTPAGAAGALSISSFAEDLDGELYLLDFSRGQVLQLEFAD